ncbi:MAG: HAMP domain-containing sensor histidine kinase, partial [Pseudomonadota bacterium]
SDTNQKVTSDMQQMHELSVNTPESKPAGAPLGTYEDQDHKQFMRIANHDLRAGLRALAELPVWIDEDMQEHGMIVPSDVQEHLDLMHRSAKDMMTLLDGLIDLSSAGRQPDEPARVTVEQAVRRAWDAIDDAPGFRLDFVDAVDTIYLPQRAVHTIFKSFLENAVHHHDQGRGKITVASENDGDHVRITIEDDGPGVPKNAREQVFESLVMLRRREETGRPGLGLTLARKLVTRLGGTVTLTQASNGHGTAVLINLPMRARL